ncbi:MAG: hypothetical protein ABGY29_02270 [bacterium]
MNNALSIRVGAKTVTCYFKFLAQFKMIVDFTIEDNPDGAILVAHWLMSGCGKIHDGQPTKSKAQASV